MVIRLGRNGRFLACSMYPEHKESRPLPGDELPPRKAPARSARSAARHARRQDRAVRAVPRVLAPIRSATTSRRRARRRRTRCRSRSSAPRTRTASSSRVAPGAPVTSSGVLQVPQVRLHDQPRAARWRARRGRRAAGAQGRGGDALVCGSTSDTAPDDIAPASAIQAGRQIRTRWHGRPVAADERALAAPVAVLVVARGAERADPNGEGARQNRPRRRERGRGRTCDPPDARAVPSLACGPRRLAAHDPCLHDRRGRSHLGWLGERGVDWRRPAGPTCAYLAHLEARPPDRPWPSGSPRCVLPSLGGARGLAAGDPQGRGRHATAARRLRASSRSIRSTACWRPSTTS